MVTDTRTSTVIDEIVRRLIAAYGPQKIILFGSYAYGRPDTDSDIDMLIVKETPTRWLDRLAAVRQVTSGAHRHIAFDPLVLTPTEIEQRLRAGDRFIAEILEKGRVLSAA